MEKGVVVKDTLESHLARGPDWCCDSHLHTLGKAETQTPPLLYSYC